MSFNYFRKTRLIVFVLIAALVGVPSFSFAQTAAPSVQELQAQVEELQRQIEVLRQQIEEAAREASRVFPATTTTPVIPSVKELDSAGSGNVVPPTPQVMAACPVLNMSLSEGATDAATGGAVSKLQRFLRDRGHFSYPEITGYFGPITEEAVKRFQESQGVVASGMPETTGYGVVGPRTRAAIDRVCSPFGQTNTTTGTIGAPRTTAEALIQGQIEAQRNERIGSAQQTTPATGPTTTTPASGSNPLTAILGPNASPQMIQQAVVGQITLTPVQEILLDFSGDGVMNTTDARLAERALAGEISWSELIRTRDSGAWEDAITLMKRFASGNYEDPLTLVFGPDGDTATMQQAIVGAISLNPVAEMILDFSGDGVMNTTDVRLAERVGDISWSELVALRNSGAYGSDIERMRTVLDMSDTNPIPDIIGEGATTQTMQEAIVGNVSLSEVQRTLLDFSGDGVMNTTDVRLAERAGGTNPIPSIIGPGATTQTMQEAIVGNVSLSEVQRTLLDFSGDGVMNTTDVRLAERAIAGELTWEDLYSMRDNGAHSADIARMKAARDEDSNDNPLPALLGTDATSATLQQAVLGSVPTTKVQRILLDLSGDGVIDTTDVRLAERAEDGELLWSDLKEMRDSGTMKGDIERMKNIADADLSWSSLKETRNNGAHEMEIEVMQSVALSANQNPIEAILFDGATTKTMQEAIVGARTISRVQRILLDFNGDGVMNTTDVRLAERVGDISWSELERMRDSGVHAESLRLMRSIYSLPTL